MDEVDKNDAIWHGKQVLVTGAGCFIGSYLVEQLVKRGADVRAFVRYNSSGDYGLLKWAAMIFSRFA
jgi:nucleoside-diphosphate-sugar epimerase